MDMKYLTLFMIDLPLDTEWKDCQYDLFMILLWKNKNDACFFRIKKRFYIVDNCVFKYYAYSNEH